MINLIKLSENDKRLIIVLLLVVILLFVIVGYVSLLVKKIMDFQGSRADDMLHDVVVSRTITDEKKLRSFAIRKNWTILFKQATIPMIILASMWLLFLCYGFFNPEINGEFAKINVWSTKDGFGTLFYTFDWETWKSYEPIKFLFLELRPNPPVVNAPHFTAKAIFSYIFVPGNAVGIGWFLIAVQAYIARTIRSFKICSKIFKKTLDKPMPLDEMNKPTTNGQSGL